MIKFQNLSVRYERPVLDQISLEIPPGQFCVLLGENGSGKSTLLLTLAGVVPVSGGRVRVTGVIGLVLQSPDEAILATTVREEVGLGLENMEHELLEGRIGQALASTGLTGYEERLTAELSGGEKQRLVLASVLARDPEILLLDEPTSFLDEGSRADLLKTLRALADRGITVVMATQELEEVEGADRVLVLHEGSVALDENSRDFWDREAELIRCGLFIPEGLRLRKVLEGACRP